jgi:hypothetical protein
VLVDSSLAADFSSAAAAYATAASFSCATTFLVSASSTFGSISGSGVFVASLRAASASATALVASLAALSA